MSTADSLLTVRGIDVEVVYKDIKHLHIAVYPPAGHVRVAAPLRLDNDRVRLAVVQRLDWIRQQRDQLRSVQRQSQREMLAGESHYVWGSRRRLKVVERPGRAHVETEGDRLILYTPLDADAGQRREALDRWYREQLRQTVPALVTKWEIRTGLAVPQWGIRRMKTKWGSCNRETRRIWLNVELAKKHPDCLEYVLVHEMAHYLEHSHGRRFTEIMDRFLPDWRGKRSMLNAAPLSEEDWSRFNTARGENTC